MYIRARLPTIYIWEQLSVILRLCPYNFFDIKIVFFFFNAMICMANDSCQSAENLKLATSEFCCFWKRKCYIKPQSLRTKNGLCFLFFRPPMCSQVDWLLSSAGRVGEGCGTQTFNTFSDPVSGLTGEPQPTASSTL